MTARLRIKDQAGFIAIILVFLIILGNVGLWYWVLRSKEIVPSSPKEGPLPTSLVEIVTKIPQPTVDESALIKQAVYKETGLDATKAEVTINQNTGTHAKGNIKEFEAVGGAYWLAAKTDAGWICVYDGQSHPTCEQIAPYNFPKDMVPECLDKNNKVITR